MKTEESNNALKAIGQWLEYGEQSLWTGHKGYFSSGGWAYEQLKLLRNRMESDDAKAHDDSISLAANVRTRRKALQLRQFDLAELAGVSESMIAKYETGRATPDQFMKEKLAAALKCSPSQL